MHYLQLSDALVNLFGKWSHSLVKNVAPTTELKKYNILKPALSAEEAGNF